MRIATLLVSVCLVAASSCTTTPAETPSADTSPRMAVTGGYAPADASAPGYKEAEALAIDTIYKREPQRSLVEAKSAQVQVVAGLNYLFDIKMSGANRYTIRIYRDLQGNLTVSEFTKTGGN
jgi:Cystatin domain